MEVALISAVVSAVLPLALSEITKRFAKKTASVVEFNILSIQNDFSSIKATIMDYPNRHKDRTNSWTTLIQAVKNLAYNVEDSIEELRVNKIGNEEFAKRIEVCKQSLTDASAQLVSHINNIEPTEALQGRASSSIAQGLVVVGIEELQRVFKELVSQSRSSQVKTLKVVPIVGPGCVATTLLARELYKDVCSEFPRHAFVSAAGKNGEQILAYILQGLLKEDHIPQNTVLRTCIQGYRYLIVIDAVESAVLADVIDACRQVTEADGIIVATTTIERVATTCSYVHGHVYKITPFNDVESENNRLMQGRMAAPNAVPLSLYSISQFCIGPNGDPIKCQTLTGHCNFYPEHDMQRMLDNSYDSLYALDLQACLLYFCMFPSGHSVRRGSLIRRWEAEGPEIGGNNKNKEKAFEALIKRSVVGPVEVSINGEVKTCKPPPKTLDYISSKSELEKFIILSSLGDRMQIRRLSLHHTGKHDDGLVLKEKEADVSRLRSLAVSRSRQHDGDPSALSFEKCELLRVLDLEECSGLEERQIDKIWELQLLKYLSLPTDLTGSVPSSITNLQWLQTLDLGKKKVVRVHVDVILLPCLKHLLGKFQLHNSVESKVRSYSEKLKASKLETLAGFVTRTGKGFPPLMLHMTRLRKVKIWFCFNAAAKSLPGDLKNAIERFLKKSTDGLSLSIDLQGCSPLLLNSLDTTNHKLFSLKLQSDNALKGFPKFVAKLNGITKLCLSWTALPWEYIHDGMSNLPNLKNLKLVADEIKDVPDAQAGQVRNVLLIKTPGFGGLQRICLVTKKNLPQIEIKSGALKDLESLHLICRNLDDRSANQIRHLTKLKEVALHSHVQEATKVTWHEAARNHPKRPYVGFIDDPRFGPTSQASC